MSFKESKFSNKLFYFDFESNLYEKFLSFIFGEKDIKIKIYNDFTLYLHLYANYSFKLNFTVFMTKNTFCNHL